MWVSQGATQAKWNLHIRKLSKLNFFYDFATFVNFDLTS